MTALNNCDDEVVKNTAGVNLFGTMWEDMGADAVKALTDTNGEFDKTADNLNKIKEIKYDSLENAFEGIKRQIETGLVLPIGEKLLPKLNEFANYINDNMPDIKNTVESVMDGLCSAISFVTDNLNIGGSSSRFYGISDYFYDCTIIYHDTNSNRRYYNGTGGVKCSNGGKPFRCCSSRFSGTCGGRRSTLYELGYN